MKNIARDKNITELNSLLKDKRNALADFSNDVHQGKAKNVKEGRSIRKQIAQIMTALSVENKS